MESIEDSPIKLNILNNRRHVWSEYHPYVLVVP